MLSPRRGPWSTFLPVLTDPNHAQRFLSVVQPGFDLVVGHQVHQRKDHNPDNVHKVPVQTSDLHIERLLLFHTTPQRHDQNRHEPDHSDCYVCPWKPVRVKNELPNMLVVSPRPSCLNAVNSKYCPPRKTEPSSAVAASQTRNPRWLPFWMAAKANTMVSELISNTKALIEV